MIKIYKKSFAVALTMLTIAGASAQDHIQLTSRDLPQSMSFNPALRPDRSFVTMPLFGGIGVGVDNSFSYRNVINTNELGQKYLNTASLLKHTRGKDLTMARVDVDILSGGFYIAPKDFMSVSLKVRAHAATSMPEGLFGAVLDNPINEYKTFDINMTPNVIGWAELGVSYTRELSRGWQVGGRLKYLQGIASVQSDGMEVTMRKDYDRYVLSGDYSLRGGNMDFANSSNFVFGHNPGVAADLGFSYTAPENRWYVLAGVRDLGAIFWNSSSSSQIRTNSGGKEYTYTGMNDINNLVKGGESLSHVLDSAFRDFSKVLGADTTSAGFTQMLPVSFHAAGSMAIDRYRRHNVSASFIGNIPYKNKLYYSASVGYAYRTANGIWQVMTNYTYKSDNPLNIGLGFVMTTGVFQLYLATDNVIACIDPLGARGMNFNLGLNFFISKKIPKKDAKYYR